jgi:hypothetical protein
MLLATFGDSGEAEPSFRREAKRDSGMISNTIGERSDAGIAIVGGSVGLRQERLSGSAARMSATNGERGKGSQPLVPARRWREPLERDRRCESQVTGTINTWL